MNAIQTLLNEIVDYAGLFPPAGLPLSEVTHNYREYMPGRWRSMLARLIVPASRLGELTNVVRNQASEAARDIEEDCHEAWRVSALIPPVNAADEAFDKAMASIQNFNDQHEFIIVDTVEGKLPESELVEETCHKLLPSLSAFLEIPWQDLERAGETIDCLAKDDRPNTYAKIRTGGVTPDLIPDVETVAGFLHKCAAANLGLKATAGLHHPLRGQFALTYLADSDRGTMHGFMNVFLAACFAKTRAWSVAQLAELLSSSDAEDFSISEDHIAFQGTAISSEEIRSVRQAFAISFGSCSFTEPVEDLIQLGWLADSAKTV